MTINITAFIILAALLALVIRHSETRHHRYLMTLADEQLDEWIEEARAWAENHDELLAEKARRAAL